MELEIDKWLPILLCSVPLDPGVSRNTQDDRHSVLVRGQRLIMEGHLDSVTCLCLLPDGRLASTSYDKTIRVWDLQTQQCLSVWRGYTGVIKFLCVSGVYLVSGSADKTVRLWDPNTGQCLRILSGHTHVVSCGGQLSEGRIVSGSFDRTLRVWSVATGDCALVIQGCRGQVEALAVLTSGLVVTGCVVYARRLCALPDGTVAATDAADNESYGIHIWDVSTGTRKSVMTGHSDRICCLAVLPSGDIASSSYENTIWIWDADTRSVVQELRGDTADDEFYVNCLLPLPDGRLVAGEASEHCEYNYVALWSLSEQQSGAVSSDQLRSLDYRDY